MKEVADLIHQAISDLTKASLLVKQPGVSAKDPPAWFSIALGELGVREIRGDQHNPRILEYHSVTGLGADDDETPWCSSFVSWCLERAGVRSTRSARARSYEDFGSELVSPMRGSIVVLWRGSADSPQGHVAFFDRFSDDGNLVLLGGNQGNRVSRAVYPRGRVVAYRYPELP